MIGGFIVNKFRGVEFLTMDIMVETRTTWQGFGVLPIFLRRGNSRRRRARHCHAIAAWKTPYRLPRAVADRKLDDLDPLSNDPNLQVSILRAGQPIPADATLAYFRHQIDERRFGVLKSKVGT